MGRNILPLFLGLILVLSTLAIVPAAPAGTQGTLTVSSDRFFGEDIDMDGDGDNDAGEALLQITLSDPDLASTEATMPYVEAKWDGNTQTLDFYQIQGGSWVAWIFNVNKPETYLTNPPGPADNDNDPATTLQHNEAAGNDVDVELGEFAGIQVNDLLVINPGGNNAEIVIVEAVDTANNTVTVDLQADHQAGEPVYPINGLNIDEGDTITIVYHDADPVVDVEVSVTYDDTAATISIDRDVYPVNGKIRVEVTDPDLNYDPTATDSIDGQITIEDDDGNQAAIDDLDETGPTTGVFKVTIDLGDYNWDEWWDSLTITYEPDDKEVYATIEPHTGEISVDLETASISDEVTVTVVDPDKNIDSGDEDTLQVSVKAEESYEDTNNNDQEDVNDEGYIVIDLDETGANTGIFTGTFGFTFADDDEDDKLSVEAHVKPETITVKYV
ncbi:MAG: hypothetical protein ACXQTV_01240, partial [Candidatus Hecatellaceae archaeon]